MKIKYFDTPFMRMTYCLAGTDKRRAKIAKQLGTKVTEIKADDDSAVVTFWELDDGAVCAVVDFNCDDEDVAVKHGLIAHEATHIKQRLMALMNETYPSSEFEAYTIQRLTTNLIDELINISK